MIQSASVGERPMARLIKTPKIDFSKWVSWGERNTLPSIENPGVYLIGRFSKPPNGKPGNVPPKETIYIGECTKQSLGLRLRQFSYSARTGRRAHAGGRTYYKRIRERCKNLYVSVFSPRGLPSGLTPFFIRHIEQDLIWKYCAEVKNKKPPKCNLK